MVFLGYFVANIVSSLFGAFVLSKLWLWFIVPIFEISPIGIVQTFGLSIVIGWFTNQYSNEEEFSKDFLNRMLIHSFSKSIVSLAIGYIAHLFM